MSGSNEVPVWMAWPTDPDTFHTTKPFDFQAAMPRSAMEPSAEKKDLKAGHVATADPDGANEEVTRNQIAYDYLIGNGLTTKLHVGAFFEENDYVDMPVGSIELKASWLQVTMAARHNILVARAAHHGEDAATLQPGTGLLHRGPELVLDHLRVQR